MSVTDLEAMRKWNKFPRDLQRRFINNVFCSNCSVTTIVDYSIKNEALGITLEGKCKNCRQDVARFIEMDK